LRGAIFNGAYGLAHLKFEILQQRREFGFELAGAVAQFHVALARQLRPFLVERVLLLARNLAVFFELRELVVQAIEEARDIHLLRSEALARGGDDAGVQAQPFGGLNAGRCAGHSKAKLIVGRQGDFIHAGRGVKHAGVLAA